MAAKTVVAQFKPRARLMELLGEQLIKDHRLALFELVKNAYDADASQVNVSFRNLDTEPRIYVEDDGTGMTLETVLNTWMEPASDHRAIARKEGQRSRQFGRLPVGEKGVGRFAVHKLGKVIKMVTKVAGAETETAVEIDWEAFVQNRYLHEAPVSLVEREPELFAGAETHGTKIRITSLKQKWTRGDIRRLYRNVAAMTSSQLPSLGLVDDTPERADKFNVVFALDKTHESWLDGMFLANDAQAYAMYRFEFELGPRGFSWRYNFEPLASMASDFKQIEARTTGETDTFNLEYFKLNPPNVEGTRTRSDRDPSFRHENLGIGTIKGRIVGFDLDQEILARYIPDASGLKRFLDEQGGVRVYRDGLRVFDYGEPGNDWLGLDLRRVNRPTKRLSNNILLGEVHLEIEQSPELREKTNREGFVDNSAYQEFRYAVLCALTQFEAARNTDKDVIRAAIAAPKPDQVDTTGYVRPEDAIAALRSKLEKTPGNAALIPYVDRVQTAYEETRDVLLSAVGAGLGLATIFHELERGVRGLDRAISTGQDHEHVTKLSDALVELMAGASTFLRTQKTEKLTASRLLDEALFSCKSRFKYHNIRLLNGFVNRPELDFEISGTRRMFVAALVNLIDNAIYWTRMGRVSAEDEGTIWIGPATELEGPALVVADSGDGFADAPSAAVQPFYTRKSDGMGMGLYYADMVMKSHRGRLAFPKPGEVEVPARCKGAVIGMVFNRKGLK